MNDIPKYLLFQDKFTNHIPLGMLERYRINNYYF